MIPNRAWFPAGLQDRVAWYENFNAQIQSIGTTVGMAAGDLTKIGSDNDMMQFLGSSAVGVDAYDEGVRSYRRAITEGVDGSINVAFPTNPSFTPPAGGTNGLFERLDGFVKRIRAAPNYTDEVGSVLGIVASSPVIQPIADMKPRLKVHAFASNLLRIEFTRGHTDGIQLQMQLDNGGSFDDVGIFPKSPVQVNVPPSDKNLPRFVMLRGRYLDGNNPDGEWSDIMSISTIP